MTNPTAAMLVIGDEILSGRTQDSNTHHLAGELTQRGIRLMEVRVVADDQPGIVAAVNALRSTFDHVFTSGGIGPTHDDITADAIAAAFGVDIGNPVSVAPGFSLGNVHVMAGVPNIFRAMLQGVLAGIVGGAPLLSQSHRVLRPESEIADAFGRLAAEFPDLSMGSYPFNMHGVFGTNLVIRGTDAARIDAAMVRLVALFPHE
jgi:molybdenum cofactor synthesis domain-containing protein